MELPPDGGEDRGMSCTGCERLAKRWADAVTARWFAVPRFAWLLLVSAQHLAHAHPFDEPDDAAGMFRRFDR